MARWYLFLLVVAGCAVPVAPTGGPPDQEPPFILESNPPDEAVNVDGQRITITFSEYLNTSSFFTALNITPEPERLPDIKWQRRTATLSFRDPLRENTTYIITLGTELRDARGVSLKQPITIAFSTGPTISRGRLAGRVIEPLAGEPVAGIDVYAYAAPNRVPPAPLPERPAYRTQTGDDGTFAFKYLTQQPYHVVAVQDLNQNRRLESFERFAVPPRSFVLADTVQVRPDSLRWLLRVPQDTLGPQLERIRSLSSQRYTLRFSEGIRLDSLDLAQWVVRDSLGTPLDVLRRLYLRPSDATLAYLVTDSLAPGPYTLVASALTDSSFNPLVPDTLTFAPRLFADTTQVRFEAFLPEELTTSDAGALVVPADQQPTVRFNQAVPAEVLVAALTAQDTTGQALAFSTRSTDGVRYAVTLDDGFASGQVVELRVDANALASADTVYTQRFQRISDDDLGELSGLARADSGAVALVAELYRTADDVLLQRAAIDSTGAFLFARLPAGGGYRMRLVGDRNGNGVWDGGTLDPFAPAEPLAWFTDLPEVRARWETAVQDTLVIPLR
ncbi:MAG: Ig-like domain-containing protein [Bacteroidota bacterium]